MTFLAPALLLGLVALTLPVIAHLMGHRQPQRVPFAGVRFLEPVDRVVTRRRAPRDIELLIARLLLLALLVVILARPASVGPTSVAVIAEPHDAIVVVDGSRSMGLEVEGATLLDHAGDRVEALLDAVPAGSRIGLVTSDPGGPRLELGDDPERPRAALREWIERGAPRSGAWTLGDAVPVAASLLSQGGDGERKRVIYAFGDRTEGGLGSLPETAEAGIPVLAIPARENTELPEHVSLDEVSWQQAPDIDPRAVRIQTVLRRHGGDAPDGAETTRQISVALLVGTEEVARTVVQAEADTDIQVEFTHQLLDGGTTFPATVALVDLDDDPLPSDDRRHLWLSPDDALEVIVANGDPSELRAHDEVFFLGTALAASESGKRMHITSLAPDQLEQRIREHGAPGLGDVDVLVLANVRAPQEDVAPALVEFVQRGAGLLITVGG
ncbi:MAG: vWA domain-containing protein, partial [Planctomycetota bacterium]